MSQYTKKSVYIKKTGSKGDGAAMFEKDLGKDVCSVLQCVAVCCSVPSLIWILARTSAVCCSVLQCVAVCCSVLQCVAVCQV